MDLEDVRRLLAGTALEDLSDELHALVRPGLRVVPGDGRGGKVGGTPDLPADATWPSIDGEPLTFLGQLRLDVLDTTVWPGPREGLLSIFARSADHAPIPWGVQGVRILHHPAGATLAPRPYPPDALQLEEQPIAGFVREWTLPDHGAGDEDPSLYVLGIGTDGPRNDAYHTLRSALGGRGYYDFVPLVLGWPLAIQGPVLSTFAPYDDKDEDDGDELDFDALFAEWARFEADHALLLQFETEAGAFISVCLPAEDLQAGRWDRSDWTMQSD